ncbi:MAG TPA: ATP-binding protein, partial [Thermoanaerobaculia bacterium]|nr:ATP-binding protein [Thermoanaerobaculia bacterium]
LAGLARNLNEMVERLRGELAAASADRDHLRTILAAMREGVLVMDSGGRAVLANPAFSRLFNLRVQTLGLTAIEICRQRELAALVDRALGPGEAGTAELELELPERRSLSLACAPLGPGAGAVVVVRDTTAFTRLARMRRDFVANVSHELKTPLAAIRGYAETLRDGALDEPETARRFLDRVLVQCRRLQALLEDLLTLSRLESTETPLPMARLELGAILTRALDLAAELAGEKGVELSREGLGELALVGHAESLERLVVNLLDNAIKYNRPGGTVVAALGRQGGEAVITITDTGIGIPADSLPRLFERFYRVDKGRSRDEGGTGLGLAIVKHIAQAHGGSVEVASQERHGSTFRVHLPTRL